MPTATGGASFVEGVFHDLIVHPLTLAIAQLAGRIEGEQAASANLGSFLSGDVSAAENRASARSILLS